MAMEKEKTAQLNLKTIRIDAKTLLVRIYMWFMGSPSHLVRPIGEYGFN